MSNFKKFPSIDSFSHVNKGVGKYFGNQELRPTITYRSKVKLHGTNAGIRVSSIGEVTAQKRTSDVFAEADNMGFARFVEDTKSTWELCLKTSDIIIYGEWAGPGIQKNVGISKIPEKSFFIFAVLYLTTNNFLVDPKLIEMSLFANQDTPENVYVIPWYDPKGIEVDFKRTSALELFVEKTNEIVLDVEERDPYVAQVFSVSGVGEGLVYYPSDFDGEFKVIKFEEFETYAFKAKGAKHNTSCNPKPVQISPEVSASIREFVDMHLTQNRLEQGLQEALNGDADMHRMGDFLKWIGGDVKKETVDELEVSDLEWKQVSKVVTSKARDWLIEEAQKL